MPAPRISTSRKLSSGRARRISGSVRTSRPKPLKPKPPKRSSGFAHAVKSIFSHSYRTKQLLK